MEEKPTIVAQEKGFHHPVGREPVRDGPGRRDISAGNSAPPLSVPVQHLPVEVFERPPRHLIPTEIHFLLIDLGANEYSKPSTAFFRHHGRCPALSILGIPIPGWASVIVEVHCKGNLQVKEAFELSAQARSTSWQRRGRGPVHGDVDEVVCDGFCGQRGAQA
jgi:fatty acid/phospholipid biosynthesis enzyme